jgi:hypothetical protein
MKPLILWKTNIGGVGLTGYDDLDATGPIFTYNRLLLWIGKSRSSHRADVRVWR